MLFFLTTFFFFFNIKKNYNIISSSIISKLKIPFNIDVIIESLMHIMHTQAILINILIPFNIIFVKLVSIIHVLEYYS